MGSERVRYSCVPMLFLLTCILHQAQETVSQSSYPLSPIGRWKSVDDATGKVKAIVVIWEQDAKLYGKIEKLVDPDPGDPDPRCTRCAGALKNRPLVGLRILWHLKKEGDEWLGGKILDPNNGKAYRCSIAVEIGGKRLKVRGFIGLSMFGRTQYWVRAE